MAEKNNQFNIKAITEIINDAAQKQDDEALDNLAQIRDIARQAEKLANDKIQEILDRKKQKEW